MSPEAAEIQREVGEALRVRKTKNAAKIEPWERTTSFWVDDQRREKGGRNALSYGKQLFMGREREAT